MEKLKSRKLWAAVLGIITGLAVAFGADADAVATVAGAVTAAVSVVSYILTEGCLDAKKLQGGMAAAELTSKSE